MKVLPRLLVLFLLFSCTKYEVNQVTNNTPPNDHTVSSETKINYINRLYITVLGYKPNEQESADALAMLSNDPKSLQVREDLVANIIGADAYEYKVWQDVRGDVLEGTDTTTIRAEYDLAVYYVGTTSGNTQIYWQEEAARLFLLLQIPQELKSNVVDMPEVHSRAVNNSIYDDINMGTENFVVSVFQNFFFRYPTIAELEAAKTMVDGQQSVLFLQGGNSKNDFLTIVFGSDAYYEGQIVNLYRKYLFRDPTSLELSAQTQDYINQKNYKQQQIHFLASDEYFYL